MKRSTTLQILLILIVSAAAIARLFHITNTSWLKLVGEVAFIIITRKVIAC